MEVQEHTPLVVVDDFDGVVDVRQEPHNKHITGEIKLVREVDEYVDKVKKIYQEA